MAYAETALEPDEWAAELFKGDGAPYAHEMAAALAAAIERGRRLEREECAKAAEAQAAVFLSPQYATNQPIGSAGERLACRVVANAIRARSNSV